MLSIKIQHPFKKLGQIKSSDSLSNLGFEYYGYTLDTACPTIQLFDSLFFNPYLNLGKAEACPQYSTLPSGTLLALVEIECYPEAIDLTKKLLGLNFKIAGSE